MEYTKGIIVSVNEIGTGIFDMLVKCQGIADAAKPGQFVCIYSDDGAHLLPRPISICEAMNGYLRLVFRVAGFGTKELSGKTSGEEIKLLGPCGNGYPELAGDQITVVGGGIGIPPMLYLARKCSENGMKVTAVLGYRDSKTFLKEAFEAYADVIIATDDGSLGVKGTVVDAMKECNTFDKLVCACGPMPMLKGLSTYVEGKGGCALISLEERMACGIGACLGCIVKTKEVDEHSHVHNKRICTEGPVFDSKELDFNR
ncbi:MAG: dihydroorotate dehydrogenase electron transfer subunit [Lachnospiraceae bacterium]|nr:dihydroorotate dehydrogenase electron transfer subunit [Lachnospiraceae bacterium]